MSKVTKNILIVVHHYRPHISGVGMVAYNHARRLAEQGYKVTVVTSDTSPKEKSYYADGVNVIRIKAWNISESWSAPFPIFSPRLLFALAKFVKVADVVHVHDAFYMSSFWASIFAWIYKKPVVLTQHVAMIAHPSKIVVTIQKIVYATTGALIFRISSTIITFNDRIEKFLIGKGVSKEKMIVLFNGVDMEIFHSVDLQSKKTAREKLGLSIDKKILLFVGRFVPKKGFDKVLAVRSKDYQIVCVGGEKPQGDFGDDVIFLGKLEQKMLAEIYQAADIFILPSESEGFPLSIQEAMATGLPIITTNDPGYAQYNFDKRYISLIDNTDEQSIRNAINAIYRDEDQLNKMGTYSEQYAKQNFNWSVSISKLTQSYTNLFIKQPKIPHLFIITPYFYPKIGGLETIAYNIARNFNQNGQYKVTVITSNHDTKGYRQDIIDGVVVHRLPIWFKISNTPINPMWYWQIRKIFKKYQPDIINVHSPVPFMADIATKAAGNIPVILTYHSGSMKKNKWPSDFFIFIYERFFLRALFRKVVAIVAYSPEFIQRELAIFNYKTYVIPPGIDLKQFVPTPLPINQKVITFVGRMGHHTSWKGITVLLHAISLVVKKYPEVQLKLVGDGDAVDYYRQIVNDLNITDHVTFCGPKTGSALTEVYKNTNVLVLPSISNSESFGIVLLEAMASGRPVIGSNIGGIPQLIDDEKNGLLITPKDPEILASAIERVITNPVLAEKFAKESVIKAQNFSWDIQLDKYNKLFINTLNSSLRKKPKKIAIVSDAVYPFNKGGKEKRIYDISRRLIGEGFDVTIYCMKWWEGNRIIFKDGVKFQAISPLYPLYAVSRRSIKQAILFSLHCFKLLNKDFDVIEVDHIPHLVLFTMKIVCVLKRKRMIVTWHEVWGKEYWKKYLGVAGGFAYFIEKISAKLPDIIISVSQHTTNNLRNILQTKKEIITIPNGLDIDAITQIAPASVGADVIFAGRLLSHKNIDILLNAISIIVKHNPSISLYVVGEGPEKMNLQKLAKKLDIEKNVSFFDFFEDHRELYSIMHASKIFALPSTREGFGIVALEANACGLPVITINQKENATRELIVNGENGILISLDEMELANAIEKLLSIKKDRSIYPNYIQKYNLNSVTSEITKVYSI